jgi:hypothetical protein
MELLTVAGDLNLCHECAADGIKKNSNVINTAVVHYSPVAETMRATENGIYLFTAVSRPRYVLKATEQLVATCNALAANPVDPVRILRVFAC